MRAVAMVAEDQKANTTSTHQHTSCSANFGYNWAILTCEILIKIDTLICLNIFSNKEIVASKCFILHRICFTNV